MKRNISFLVLLFLIGVSNVFSQSISITFGVVGLSTDTLSSVKVENLNQGTSLTLNGSDILSLTTVTDIKTITGDKGIQIVPNPMNNNGEIHFYSPNIGNTSITITDASGKIVIKQVDNLQVGNYSYSIVGLPSGIYFANIVGANFVYNTSIVSIGTGNQTISLKQINAVTETLVASKLKSFKSSSIVSMNYIIGDSLQFTGTCGTLTSTVKDVPISSGQISFVFYGSIKDQDSNICKTIIIGSQTWMAENLKVITYNDGIIIPNVTDGKTWDGLTTGAQCDYNNSISYTNIYGKLYNWYAVNSNKLCPSGWHVPNDSEWVILSTAVGGGSTSGGALKETDTTHWSYPNKGATNISGFTALPGGCRGIKNHDIVFQYIGILGNWWCNNENGVSYANSRLMDNSDSSLGAASYNYKSMGSSVRCLKN